MIGKNNFFLSIFLFVFLLTGCSLGGSSNGNSLSEGAEESYTIKWKNWNKHLYWKFVFMFLSIWNNSSYLSSKLSQYSLLNKKKIKISIS